MCRIWDKKSVELRGIEPLASSLRTRRATNCATAPRSKLSTSGTVRLALSRLRLETAHAHLGLDEAALLALLALGQILHLGWA
jgi:hypothetical protein